MSDDPNGHGSDNPNGTDEPQFVTPDQLNRAITAHLSRFEKSVAKSLSDRDEQLLSKIAEQLQSRPAPEHDEPKGSKGDEESGLVEKLRQKFDRELAEERKRIQRIEQEREAERAKSRDLQLRQSVREALSSVGIEGTRQKAAMALLVDAEKRIALTDDGAVQFTDADGFAVSLKDGLGGWVKSEDAQVFLPPRNVAGSGDRSRPQAGATPDPNARRNQLLDMM